MSHKIKVNTLDTSVKQLVIGRRGDAQYPIDDDEYVSNRHALLLITGPGQLRIEDLGSLNGMSLNGHRILLSATVGVGSYVLRVGRTDIELVVI